MVMALSIEVAPTRRPHHLAEAFGRELPHSTHHCAKDKLHQKPWSSQESDEEAKLERVADGAGGVRTTAAKNAIERSNQCSHCKRAVANQEHISMFAHGLNIGHGYTKYIVINEQGEVLPPLVFPSQVAMAEDASAGAIVATATVEVGGVQWWTGEDAGRLGSPIVKLGHDRLTDPVFIPALALAARDRMGLNGCGEGGYCVSGLPGSWAEDQDMCRTLFDQVKKALPNYFHKVLVIAEQEALCYARMLDNNGQVVGDSCYAEGRGLSLDLGHHTDDAGKLDHARRVKGSFNTYRTGTARALGQLKNLLMARFDRDFSLHDADVAVRNRSVTLGGGRRADLPRGWDSFFIDNATDLVNSLQLDYNNGGDLDYVLLGGGGALNEFKVDAIQKAYSFAEVVSDPSINDDPQLAIALGYARVARKRMAEQGLI